jgi:hypothetical protein
MRQTWAMRIAAPVLAATALAACSRHVSENDGSDRRKYAGGQQAQIIGLKGCVEGAPDPNEFVLRNVQLEPIPSQPTDAATGPGVSVTEGSSVRLKITDSDQLKKNLGQIVSVTGMIIDDGRSTIGTGGKPRDPDQQEQPADTSRAAAPEHHSERVAQEAGPIGRDSMANGTVPRMSVDKVTGTGERCKTELRPEARDKSGSDEASGSSPQSK